MSSPQPPSKADQNSDGANGQCPGGAYCSTRDGSPSGNGNGKGKAVGKPCAGCVGKADNKNPHGQRPNGSDHNAGYECDRNHGIGRTNPAHTGCLSTPPGPPPCVDTPEKPCNPPPPCVVGQDEECTPPPPCVKGEDEECTPPTPCVAGVDEECTPNRPPTVRGVETVRPPTVVPAGLPSTGAGASLEPLALAGLGLVLLGGALVALRRRA